MNKQGEYKGGVWTPAKKEVEIVPKTPIEKFKAMHELAQKQEIQRVGNQIYRIKKELKPLLTYFSMMQKEYFKFGEEADKDG